jgi:Trypsin-like peptidase domain/SEC-C motif
MFFTDLMTYSTTRVLCETAGGQASTGTAFAMLLNVTAESSIPVLVTNRHVVAGARKGKFWLTLKKQNEDAPEVGEHHSFELEDFERRWIFHPSADLAIMPINPLIEEAKARGHTYFFSPLASDLIPTATELADLPALLDVVLVGYPNGIWDEKNNQPIFRRGITATHPELDYNGKPEFLIDAACFNGSSGSPVFLAEIGRTMSRSQGIHIGPSRIRLLGVLYAGPQHLATGEVVTVEIGSKLVAKTGIPNNLGIVISAKALLDFDPVLQHLVRHQKLPGRNEPCPCSSGKRYKECHGVVS